ncbi:MAG: hypothetical protein ACM3PZ_02855 [Bacillota bacterium]
MAKYLLAVLALLLIFLAGIYRARSLDVVYKDGDAIYYKNRIIIASADSGNIEIFSLGGERVDRLMTISHPSRSPRSNDNYSAVKLEQSDSSLIAYAVSGGAIFKYDISNLYEPVLEKKVKNNLGDVYYDLSSENGRLITYGSKGISIWNGDLEVVVSYPLVTSIGTASVLSPDIAVGVDPEHTSLLFYNRGTRDSISVPVNFKSQPDKSWNAAYDPIVGSILIIDDYYMKNFDAQGTLLGSHINPGGASYGAAVDGASSAAFFTNGMSILKLDISNMELLGSMNSTQAAGRGSRLMGIRLVETAFGKRLVVFAGDSISILDSDLNRIGYSGNITHTEELLPSESLFLNLSDTSAVAGQSVSLDGGGFWPQEPLIISIGEEQLSESSGKNGRFQAEISIPELPPGMQDIKVTGEKSEMTYSISIRIEE